jgi:hypothetical protein
VNSNEREAGGAEVWVGKDKLLVVYGISVVIWIIAILPLPRADI